MKQNALVLMGAGAGGLIGYFGFLWIAHQGFYALVLPGGLLGIGASLVPNRSTAICVVCGLIALVLGFLAEWQFAPFIKDSSLGFFLTWQTAVWYFGLESPERTGDSNAPNLIPELGNCGTILLKKRAPELVNLTAQRTPRTLENWPTGNPPTHSALITRLASIA